MADIKNPKEKQAAEKSEGKYHYNPGNQSGKEAEIVPKEDPKKAGVDPGLDETSGNRRFAQCDPESQRDGVLSLTSFGNAYCEIEGAACRFAAL
jgi:hypothetical protein